jgi:D-alanine transaminase
MKEIVYLNGQFLPRSEARISPDDRGFIFADGIYEVIKYYGGKPFRFGDHILRLKRSLGEIGLSFDAGGLKEIFEGLLAKNGLGNTQAGVYLQITRGAEKRVHYFPVGINPTVYAFAFDFPSSKEKLEKGVGVITHEDIRWHRCDIKSVSLLPNTMLYNKAVEVGAGECILIRNGFVTEATHSSVLGVKGGKLLAHPLTNLVLPGITRIVIKEICESSQVEFAERAFTKDELYAMDEIIIAGTGSEIMPATSADGNKIGDGKPGPLTKLIQDKFFELTR